MKSILKTALIVLGISATMFFSSCGNGQEATDVQQHEHSDTTSHNDGHVYLCPMNCEDGKTYSEPGKCPKCGMGLEEKKIDE